MRSFSGQFAGSSSVMNGLLIFLAARRAGNIVRPIMGKGRGQDTYSMLLSLSMFAALNGTLPSWIQVVSRRVRKGLEKRDIFERQQKRSSRRVEEYAN